MIGIVTHTRGNARWIAECEVSVRAALIPEARHEIRVMRDDYTSERWRALQDFEFCGFVDDDDTVHADAVRLCHRALIESGAGVAFTAQAEISELGVHIRNTPPAQRYFDVAMTPQAIHHFALIRRDAVGIEAFNTGRELGIGIDWLMKANAALRHGAIFVPMVGYSWRKHEGQDYKQRAADFEKASAALRSTTASWLRSNARIPQYTLQ